MTPLTTPSEPLNVVNIAVCTESAHHGFLINNLHTERAFSTLKVWTSRNNLQFTQCQSICFTASSYTLVLQLLQQRKVYGLTSIDLKLKCIFS